MKRFINRRPPYSLPKQRTSAGKPSRQWKNPPPKRRKIPNSTREHLQPKAINSVAKTGVERELPQSPRRRGDSSLERAPWSPRPTRVSSNRRRSTQSRKRVSRGTKSLRGIQRQSPWRGGGTESLRRLSSSQRGWRSSSGDGRRRGRPRGPSDRCGCGRSCRTPRSCRRRGRRPGRLRHWQAACGSAPRGSFRWRRPCGTCRRSR